jgi:hypothetical protein
VRSSSFIPRSSFTPGAPGLVAGEVVAVSGGIIPGIALGVAPAGASVSGPEPGSVPLRPQAVDLRRTQAPGPGALGATRSPGLRIYGISSMDAYGRVIDKGLFQLLRWEPGTRVRVGVDARHRVVVAARRDGETVINPKGMVLIPARIRRWCRLGRRERVLLVAVPSMSALVITGLEALDALLPNPRAVVDGMRTLGELAPIPQTGAVDAAGSGGAGGRR